MAYEAIIKWRKKYYRMEVADDDRVPEFRTTPRVPLDHAITNMGPGDLFQTTPCWTSKKAAIAACPTASKYLADTGEAHDLETDGVVRRYAVLVRRLRLAGTQVEPGMDVYALRRLLVALQAVSQSTEDLCAAVRRRIEWSE